MELLGGIPTYSYGTWTIEIKDLPMKMMDLSIVLGGIPTPLKNMSASVGMIIPNGKIEHLPNHQPGNECGMISAKHVLKRWMVQLHSTWSISDT